MRIIEPSVAEYPKTAECATIISANKNPLEAPVIIRKPDGASLQLKVDAFFRKEGFIAIGGWISGKMPLGLASAHGQIVSDTMEFFPRPDVNIHLGTSLTHDHGFAICGRLNVASDIFLVVENGMTFLLDPKKCVNSLNMEMRGVFGEDVYGLIEREDGKYSGNKCISSNPAIKCEIGHVIRWPDENAGAPMLVCGWLAAPDDVEFRVTGNDGLPEICWHNRADKAIANDVFINSSRLGNGFVFIVRRYPLEYDKLVLALVRNGREIKKIEKQINTIFSYHELLKTVFSIEFKSTELSTIYSAAYIPLFRGIQSCRSRNLKTAAMRRGQIGKPAADAAVAVIIPLYGTVDMLETQMQCLGQEANFNSNAELIFVIADPDIFDSFLLKMPELCARFSLSCRWVASNCRVSFAEAGNIGASCANGKTLIFMNSDVMPRSSGWINSFVNFLADNPQTGIAGCKLLYPDGRLQHFGVELEFNASLGIWRCIHLHEGEMPCKIHQESPIYALAVTGACVAIRRMDFDAVGQWRTDYLLGGYEDIDICMALQKAGKKVACMGDVEVIHLAHKSFETLGVGEWLKRLQVYNAIVFGERFEICENDKG